MTEIKFGGFGGQGIGLLGSIVAKAAALHGGLDAVLTKSYGPEARGGASSTGVIISAEGAIDYPYVLKPDVMIIMSQEAATKYAPEIVPGGTLIVDEKLVTIDFELPEGVIIRRIPATSIAESLGKTMVANIVMLGFFTSVTGLVDKAAMEATIAKTVPARFLSLNQKAFKLGFEHEDGGEA